MPKGSISASGNSITNETYKFVGCCIVKSANISSNVKFQYSPPNLIGTPLKIFLPNNSGSSYAGWDIGSWGNN